MSVATVYVLDANVFIEAARRYYAFDLVPRFWTSLEQLARDRRVCSVDRVGQELARGRDRLAEWASAEFAGAFASTGAPRVLEEFRNIMQWVAA